MLYLNKNYIFFDSLLLNIKNYPILIIKNLKIHTILILNYFSYVNLK